MSLAAEHDFVARQYRDAYAGLFDLALPALGSGFPWDSLADCASPGPATVAAVQRLYLVLLSTWPDSHIVRKHGEAVAQTVMASAQAWCRRAQAGEAVDGTAEFNAWDESLKFQGINPGTSADLTVATLMMAGLTRMESRGAAA
jgi:triphosphoribosyl-dephospho-CoA synthase